MAQPPRHSVSVAAAVLDDEGRVLAVQRRDNGRWEPPGGVLELGESIEAGLVREVREETGALVAAVALTGVYKNMARGIVALVFRCRIVEGAVRMTDEAQAFRWLRSDELADYMDEVYAVRMRDALVGGSPAVRSHDGRVLLS